MRVDSETMPLRARSTVTSKVVGLPDCWCAKTPGPWGVAHTTRLAVSTAATEVPRTRAEASKPPTPEAAASRKMHSGRSQYVVTASGRRRLLAGA